MGVWQKSKASAEIARKNDSLLLELKNILPDLDFGKDVGSSPYSIMAYEIDENFGTKNSLKSFRERLKKSGLKLILDFVPNHMAIDHEWVETNAEYFINGSYEDLKKNPNAYFQAKNNKIIAFGKDPYFPAWPDVAQLNYSNPETRKAMAETVNGIAKMCDGMRCDMAMLILNKIQKQIWGDKTKYLEPANEFWNELIPLIKKEDPGFIFIAEAYWGLEDELISYGFDFVYDIDFYHALIENNIDRIKTILSGGQKYSKNRLRFVENHDEPRALASFGRERALPATIILALTNGGHLFYQGQMEGFSKRLSVYLLRKASEDVNEDIYSFYENYFKALVEIKKLGIPWQYFEPEQDNANDITNKNILAFSCGKYVAVVNYAHTEAKVKLKLDLSWVTLKYIVFSDKLSLVKFEKKPEDVVPDGLHLMLSPYDFHLFKIEEQN